MATSKERVLWAEGSNLTGREANFRRRKRDPRDHNETIGVGRGCSGLLIRPATFEVNKNLACSVVRILCRREYFLERRVSLGYDVKVMNLMTDDNKAHLEY